MSRSVPSVSQLAKRLGPHLCGQLAEKIALVSYVIRGYQPIKLPQNMAQTDLTLRRGGLILLVEVKFRRKRDLIHHAVSPSQRKRLERQMRMVAGRFPSHALRLEVLLVSLESPFIERIQTPYI